MYTLKIISHYNTLSIIGGILHIYSSLFLKHLRLSTLIEFNFLKKETVNTVSVKLDHLTLLSFVFRESDFEMN